MLRPTQWHPPDRHVSLGVSHPSDDPSRHRVFEVRAVFDPTAGGWVAHVGEQDRNEQRGASVASRESTPRGPGTVTTPAFHGGPLGASGQRTAGHVPHGRRLARAPVRPRPVGSATARTRLRF